MELKSEAVIKFLTLIHTRRRLSSSSRAVRDCTEERLSDTCWDKTTLRLWNCLNGYLKVNLTYPQMLFTKASPWALRSLLLCLKDPSLLSRRVPQSQQGYLRARKFACEVRFQSLGRFPDHKQNKLIWNSDFFHTKKHLAKKYLASGVSLLEQRNELL